MADTVQQVKDKLSIVEVVSGYVKLERAGGSLRARCPFHAERTPSFFVSPERGTYHCFGCQSGGDIFSFVQQIEGLDFKGALRILAERAGVPLTYEKKEKRDSRERLFEVLEAATIFYQSELSSEARSYLTERGLPEEIIKEFRVGEAPEAWSAATEALRAKGYSEKELLDTGISKRGERGALYDRLRSRIVFPISDSAGRVVGFSGRIFSSRGREHADTGGSDAPKYLNSPETDLFRKSRILYGFDKAKQVIRKHNFAILVEGQMDLLMSHAAGWGNTVAVSGTAFTQEHASMLRRMSENLVIALDADEAGIKAAARAARAALQAGLTVKVARMPLGKDPAELVRTEGAAAWKAAIKSSSDIILFLLDVLHEHIVKDAKDSLQSERFRKSVETVVLPFLSDVQSPIQKDRYVQEVAHRLHVRPEAVLETLEKLPQTKEAPEREAAAKHAVRAADRTRLAFSLVLWLESLDRPPQDIDMEKIRADFSEAVGGDVVEMLGKMPESEKEALRFGAQKMYSSHAGLSREADALFLAIKLDKLATELQAESRALREAEASGNDALAATLNESCRQLSKRIAQLKG